MRCATPRRADEATRRDGVTQTPRMCPEAEQSQKNHVAKGEKGGGGRDIFRGPLRIEREAQMREERELEKKETRGKKMARR